MQILPDDEHNQSLVALAHPPEWTNPRPTGRYNLVAIGGGTAGIISAVGTAGLGGKAALVERHLLGGDCLNTGCVPSKALLRAARAAHEHRGGDEFGLSGGGPARVDFAAVMQRMRRLRAGIAQHDSAERFTGLGVDVYFGTAKFIAAGALEVDGQRLEFRRAVIATGARPAVPPIEGLADVDHLTNETIFSLTELPRRLIVIGAGPIGCELAQAFRRFGSEVHVIDLLPRVLSKEDPDAAALVEGQLRREGVYLHLGQRLLRVEMAGDAKVIVIERGGRPEKILADAILVAMGRQPNVEGLGLEAAGVRYSRRGVEVDARLRTSNRRIYAAGDVCSAYQFTHAADAMARMCIRNALFLGRQRIDRLLIPRCTYTDPEVAQAGLTADEARQQGIEIDSYRAELAHVDRAVLDGEEGGFAVIHTVRGRGRVVGATIVAAHAGEMIGEVALLMTTRLSPAALSETIHCYPTQVEVLKRIGDAYMRSRLTPRVAGLFRRWLAWRR